MLMFLVISASMCGYFPQKIGETYIKGIKKSTLVNIITALQ